MAWYQDPVLLLYAPEIPLLKQKAEIISPIQEIPLSAYPDSEKLMVNFEELQWERAGIPPSQLNLDSGGLLKGFTSTVGSRPKGH